MLLLLVLVWCVRTMLRVKLGRHRHGLMMTHELHGESVHRLWVKKREHDWVVGESRGRNDGTCRQEFSDDFDVIGSDSENDRCASSAHVYTLMSVDESFRRKSQTMYKRTKLFKLFQTSRQDSPDFIQLTLDTSSVKLKLRSIAIRSNVGVGFLLHSTVVGVGVGVGLQVTGHLLALALHLHLRLSLSKLESHIVSFGVGLETEQTSRFQSS